MPFICCTKLHSLFTQKNIYVSLFGVFYIHNILLCFVCVCVCVRTVFQFSLCCYPKYLFPQNIYQTICLLRILFCSSVLFACDTFVFFVFWGFLVFHHRNDCISVFFLWFLAIHKNALILFFILLYGCCWCCYCCSKFFFSCYYIYI